MPLSGYQLPSPRAIEAPAGEYGLAAKSSNPDAFLLRLMAQRGLAQNDYDKELAAQHVFALQQQQAQIHDSLTKNALDAAKLPGGGRLLAEPGNPMGMSLGASPGALTNLAQAGEDEQSAKNFQANMTGLNQGAQGGYQLAPGSPLPPGMPAGMSFTNLSPALVRAAEINAAARRDAAAIAAGGKGMKEGLSVINPVVPVPGGELATTSNFSGIRTQADYDEAMRRAKLRAEQSHSDRSGGSATGVTSLPLAPKDTSILTGDDTPLGNVTKAPGVADGPGTKPATSTQAAPAKAPVSEQAIDTNSPLGKAAQTRAMQYVDAIQKKAAAGDAPSAAALADIRAGMTGAAFPIVMKADGGVYIKGSKPGQDYLLGQPTPGKR